MCIRDRSKALQHLPEKDILAAVGSPHGIIADTTPSGKPGMITRTPNDPVSYTHLDVYKRQR